MAAQLIRARVKGEGIIAHLRNLVVLWAGAVANMAATLGFHSLVTHSTKAATYSAISVLISTGAVATSVANGIQFVIARDMARNDISPRLAMVKGMRSCVVPLVVFCCLAAAASPLSHFLHLKDPFLVVLSALYGGTTVLVGLPAGAYLGLSRFGAVSFLSASAALLRIPVFLVFKPFSSITAAAVGSSLISVLIVVAVSIPMAAYSQRRQQARLGEGRHGTEGLVNSLLALAFWLVVTILGASARHFLLASRAGRFNAALLIASALLFFTTPVTNAFFTTIARQRSSRPFVLGLLVTCAVCAAGVVAATLFGDLAVKYVYGSSYQPGAAVFFGLFLSTSAMSVFAYLVWAGKALALANAGLLLIACVVVVLAGLASLIAHQSEVFLSFTPLLGSILPLAALLAWLRSAFKRQASVALP